MKRIVRYTFTHSELIDLLADAAGEHGPGIYSIGWEEDWEELESGWKMGQLTLYLDVNKGLDPGGEKGSEGEDK